MRSGKWEWRRTLVAYVALMLPALWLFQPAFGGRHVLAFRDGAHYYYPLWHWMDAEWKAGRPPLWNPQENNGCSLAADPTAGLWYPGQLLLRLPCPFNLRYHIFLCAHFVAAAWGAHAAARRLGIGNGGGIAAGLSYAYGGVVLFTYANPVYLIGAAWLPWGIAAVIRHLRALSDQPSLRIPLALVVPLVMLVLGGDPQSAVHLGLIALAGLALARPVGARNGDVAWRDRLVFVVRGLLSFGGAALLAAMVAAIQVAPTLQSLDQTERVRDASPDQDWFAPLAAGTHAETRYEFSVGPWRWGELMWPNVSGRMFPAHRRWVSALPAEGRIWTPTLYAGAIPVVLALYGLVSRRGAVPVRWFAGTTALAALSACGHYGLGWLMHEATLWLTGRVRCADIGAHVGGVYWLLTQILPGYELFRYPAKWWTVAALGLALLAAIGWETLWPSAAASRKQRSVRSRFAIVSWSVLILTGGGIVGLELLSYGGLMAEASRRVPPDDWFGPFDAENAWGDVRRALTQSFLSVGVLIAVNRARVAADSWRASSKRRLCHGICAAILVAWIGCDLVLANRWTLNWLAVEEFAITRDDAELDRPWGRWYRAASTDWWPTEWRNRASTERLAETLRWERDSHFPKLNLLRGEWLVSREDAWCVAEWRLFLDAASELGPLRADGIHEPSRNLLDALSVRWLAFPPGVALPYDRIPVLSSNLQYLENRRPLPRAWLVQHVEAFAGPLPRDAQVAAQRRREILSSGGSSRDFGASAVVEADRLPTTLIELAYQDPYSLEPGREDCGSCRILEAAPTRLIVEVDVSRPALLVVNDAYDPDWKAERVDVATGVRRRVDVLRTNRVMRGVEVAPGKQRLEFHYRPASLRFGLGCSLFGCVAWFGAWWSQARRESSARAARGSLVHSAGVSDSSVAASAGGA